MRAPVFVVGGRIHPPVGGRDCHQQRAITASNRQAGAAHGELAHSPRPPRPPSVLSHPHQPRPPPRTQSAGYLSAGHQPPPVQQVARLQAELARAHETSAHLERLVLSAEDDHRDAMRSWSQHHAPVIYEAGRKLPTAGKGVGAQPEPEPEPEPELEPQGGRAQLPPSVREKVQRVLDRSPPRSGGGGGGGGGARQPRRGSARASSRSRAGSAPQPFVARDAGGTPTRGAAADGVVSSPASPLEYRLAREEDTLHELLEKEREKQVHALRARKSLSTPAQQVVAQALAAASAKSSRLSR
jgi:hypothetical protein